MRAISTIGLTLFAMLATGSAFAQPCDHRFRVTLGDSSVICLDRHPLGELLADFSGQPLASRLPNSGIYAIHVARGASCPSYPRLFIPRHWGLDRRRWLADALAECEAYVHQIAPTRECKCRRLVVNQASTLPRGDFDRLAGMSSDR